MFDCKLQEFVNWFTSYRAANLTFQGQTMFYSAQAAMPESQWMFAANKAAPIPSWFDAVFGAGLLDCVACSYAAAGVVSPSNVTMLNSKISASVLTNNLNSWLQEWQAIRTYFVSSDDG